MSEMPPPAALGDPTGTILEMPRKVGGAVASGLVSRCIEPLLVGGATLILFPLVWLLRKALGAEPAEDVVDFVAFHAAVLINNPHFAVTYLLFYRDGKNRAFGKAFPPSLRARYLFAGLVVPIALCVWALRALSHRSAASLGLLIQLMFLLVGWHYAKQGFGILAVLSARRGFFFSRFERYALLAHCFAAWAYAWASPYDPGKGAQEKGVVYTTVSHPIGFERLAQLVFFASAIALGAVLFRRFWREKKLPPLDLLGCFLITVWLWTVYTTLDRLMMYIIPALHSVQYLYMVWLLRRNQARAFEGPPHFGKPASVKIFALAIGSVFLGWVLFRGAPSFLDGAFSLRTPTQPVPDNLGSTPFFAAIYVIVNIHHYFMDNVVWRRDNPETGYLKVQPSPHSTILE